jgi:uncharacterized protein YndB with AHSA1/START domain
MNQIEETYTFKAPVAKVWRAFTDTDMAGQWGADPATVNAVEGGIFSYWAGDIHGTFTKLVPYKLIEQDWYGHDNPTWKYRVRFEFEDHGDSTTLHFLYEGTIVDIKRDANDWNEYYFNPIKRLVEL